MKTINRAVAAMEMLLVFPAALFMTALVVRNLQPLQGEPALTAQRIVAWYTGRMWTLWVLLIALPFTALITGCAVLVTSWNGDHELPRGFRQALAAVTLSSGVILAIVVLHMLAN